MNTKIGGPLEARRLLLLFVAAATSLRCRLPSCCRFATCCDHYSGPWHRRVLTWMRRGLASSAFGNTSGGSRAGSSPR